MSTDEQLLELKRKALLAYKTMRERKEGKKLEMAKELGELWTEVFPVELTA